MRGISEELLIEEMKLMFHLNKTERGMCIQGLIDQCQELKEPWLTLDEFFKSGFEGFCWIQQDCYVENSYFDGETFFESSTGSHCYQAHNISHVMPIHKPEPPR